MCGIAGVVGHGGPIASVVARVQSMTDTQRHRGPDDGGVNLVSELNPIAVL